MSPKLLLLLLFLKHLKNYHLFFIGATSIPPTSGDSFFLVVSMPAPTICFHFGGQRFQNDGGIQGCHNRHKFVEASKIILGTSRIELLRI